MTSDHGKEVAAGHRFEFGKNWKRFSSLITEARITAAEQSLQEMLECERLDGKTFLDVGSGSGLFSLAAARLGAEVCSFDYDPDSVSCTRSVKDRHQPLANWLTKQGSVLDKAFLEGLGQFDIVYAWGVLHHTGAMWQALENIGPLVREGGCLFVSIYNDQGSVSWRWKKIKQTYNRVPRFLRPAIAAPILFYYEGRALMGEILRGRNPVQMWMPRDGVRGMSRWHNWLDWLGGYPFEVAKPEQVFDFYRHRGFELRKLNTQGGSPGCNEFVFVKGRHHGAGSCQSQG